MKSNIKKLSDLKNLKGKTVLLRLDLNVPVQDGAITNDFRILESMKTINYLLEKESKVVIFSHYGRIKGAKDKKDNSLKLVYKRIKELVDVPIIFSKDSSGPNLKKIVKDSKPVSIVVVENTRYEDAVGNKESSCNVTLAKHWASLGNVFINDAFGSTHRRHASNFGIPKYIKGEKAVGFLMEKEVSELSKLINSPKRPFVALMGGAKISDKIELVEFLLKKADKVIIGTAMCNTFNLAKGFTVGDSLVELDKVDLAKKLLEKYGNKIILANDFIASTEFSNNKKGKSFKDNIADGYQSMDIGKRTRYTIKYELEGAGTILWNGPFGVTEFSNFRKGSKSIIKSILKQKNAIKIIGGGDSAAMIISMGLQDRFTHVSTGGGASLEFIKNGGKLSTLDVLL